MPGRYLKESIKRSAEIDSLTCFEEVVFYRLLVTVDDFGRYYADSCILKSDLFPRKQNLTTKSVEEAICALERKQLLTRYMANGTPYLYLNTFQKHNKPRAAASKFPDPAASCKQMQAVENSCKQMQANVPVFVFDKRIRESYSESENARTHTRGELKPFGTFGNVLLSESEHAALLDLIPSAAEYIERFSARLAAKGYTYQNHYAAIVSWYIDDKKEQAESSFDAEDFWQAAMNRPLKGESHGNT